LQAEDRRRFAFGNHHQRLGHGTPQLAQGWQRKPKVGGVLAPAAR
jgi:hypothetical protein